MKKSEIDELKKAFNIPEPERKEEFLSSIQFKLKKNKCRLFEPKILRYCSAVTAAAVVAGLWSGLKSSKELTTTINNNDRTIQTDPETIQTTTVSETVKDNSTSVSRPFNDNETATTTVKPADTKKHEIILPPVHSDENTENYQQSAVITAVSAGTNKVTSTAAVTTAKNTASSSKKTNSVTTGTIPITTTEAATKKTITTTTEAATFIVPTVTTTTFCETEAAAATTTSLCAGGSPPDTFSDYRVTPEKIYRKSDNYTDVEDYFTFEPSSDIETDTSSLTFLVNSSDTVLSGYVIDIIYTQCSGIPYTQADIMVNSSYRSEKIYNSGDMLSVYIPGGYMSAADFLDINGIADWIPRDGTVFYQGGSSGKLKAGSECIFFLNEPDGTVPDGAYILTDNTDSNVFIRNNAGEYVSLNYAERKFSLSELLAVIQDMKS